jgi:DNA invertase Pin-like site-specific DNA recombinase
MTTSNYKRINAYIRSATGEEESIFSQIKDIESYCNEHFPGLPISWFIDIHCSGNTPVNSRKAYIEMLRATTNNEPSICIMRDVSRISRNNIEFLEAAINLMHNNATLITTATGDNDPRLYFMLHGLNNLFRLDKHFACKNESM